MSSKNWDEEEPNRKICRDENDWFRRERTQHLWTCKTDVQSLLFFFFQSLLKVQCTLKLQWDVISHLSDSQEFKCLITLNVSMTEQKQTLPLPIVLES